jgi:hypothetical protein
MVSDDDEDEYQMAEDFLEDFQKSLEFSAEGDPPIVDQEFHCPVCMKKNLETKLVVMAIEEDPERDRDDPLVILECDYCKSPYRMRFYYTKGTEVSLDFMAYVAPAKPAKPPATVSEMPKRA